MPSPLDINELTPYRSPRQAIPGLDVDEFDRRARPRVSSTGAGRAGIPGLNPPPLPDLPEADFKYFERNNPNVGPNGSAQAQAYQASRAAQAAPSVAADIGQASRVNQAGYEAGGRAYKAGNIVGQVLRNPLVRGAGKLLGAGMVANEGVGFLDAYETPTQEYAKRMGIDPQATVVPQLAKDLGIRTLGATQDVVNSMTGGLADRTFNALAGNGFNRSYERYNPMPEERMGNLLDGNGFTYDPIKQKPDAAAGPAAAPQQPNAVGNAAKQQPLPGQDIGGGIRRIENGGSTLYTNVADQGPFNASRGGYASFEPSKSGFGPSFAGDGTNGPSSDNQIRAANLRDGIDINRGIGGNQGGVTNLSDGYSQRLAQLNADTTASGRRFDANLTHGIQGDSLLQQAQHAEDAPRVAAEAEANRRAQLEAAGIHGRSVSEQSRIGAETAQRGQDIGLVQERDRSQSARDVASLNSDARVNAAEARANRFLVVPGGQEVREIGGLPVTTHSPSRVFDVPNNRYAPLDDGAQGAKAAQATPRADFDKMPKGARYTGPDGKTYIKG